MKSVNLLFPHQLFEQNPLLANGHPVYLVELDLFFTQYSFHQQKIAFHRASMQAYADFLKKNGVRIHYIEARESLSDIRQLIGHLGEEGITTIHYIDPTDDWLGRRIQTAAQRATIQLQMSPSPLFLNTPDDLQGFFKPSKKKFFQTTFYKQQRKVRQILVDAAEQPIGGKWTYDVDNRKRYPRKKIAPAISYPDGSPYYESAKSYVQTYFSQHYGSLSEGPLYPHTFASTRKWFRQFLEQRFHEFGDYEDAIVAQQSILHHSVLTPMLNVGLITPQTIIEESLAFAEAHQVPLNSLEGFIRQIIGWREFIRGVYEVKGREERTRNFWGFTRKIPAAFYDGTTGLLPVDLTIKKVLKTGYCHHIERLMVLGNFMLLCEFDPDEVYRWFMELFIDAYDWVMVPNVYGMSQFADGGLMSTKPYISSSNYLMKMSDYPKGEWQQTWDALFWRFMHIHRDFFLKNPRLGMLVRTFDKMDSTKQNHLLQTAEKYLDQL